MQSAINHFTSNVFHIRQGKVTSCFHVKSNLNLNLNCLNNVLLFNYLTVSDEFVAAISENCFCDSVPAIVEVEKMNYNPFDYNTIGIQRVMEDVDPDN